MGRPSLYRPQGQMAAFDDGRGPHRRGRADRRADVRRVFDRRLESDQRERHGAAARSRRGLHRPVFGDADDDRVLRRPRTLDRRPLHARSAQLRQARRGVSEDDRHRRHDLRRPGSRVLHVRRCKVRKQLFDELLQDRRYRAADEHRHELRPGQPWSPPSREGRLFPRGTCRQRAGHSRRDGFDDDRDGPAMRQASSRGRRRAARTRPDLWHAGPDRRPHADLQIRRPHGCARLWQDRDVHAQADQGGQRQRHAHAHVDLGQGQPAVRGQRLCGLVRHLPVFHRGRHQAREGAERVYQPVDEQLQAARARL